MPDLPTITFQRAPDLPDGAVVIALQNSAENVTVMIHADHITEPACAWLAATFRHLAVET